MDTDIVGRISANPHFKELVARRTSFAWLLTGAMLVIYFGFILLVAFAKGFLAIRIGTSVTTIGIPIGLGVIVAAFVLTGIYVRRANSQFDALTRKIVEETK
ncbi:DUF485 domain-containing protein [Blastochloris viridis]|uniref:Inner membrane protein yjcH n=1 Tax=Blastochloris viridis TaxID=1079 RepID=A0A0H5BEE6_BLAVI|nr:DUF485 domain-containing protein [Blastochloris viridis]ALK09526.1 Inner membrane protein YjcH [Blastochloris viridis]BAS00586.1 putative membrane protein [Blastochloris viridis]CUU42189.1 Inner membrane protein yjcH [Blastochloris viridis]